MCPSRISDNPEEIKTKIDFAWEKIFSELNVLEKIEFDDVFIITAKQINELTGMQARILARMDSSDSRPIIFEDNNLCILQAGKRGSYVIGRFDAFTVPEYDKAREVRIIPDAAYKVNNPLKISREPDAILSAFNYGMFSDVLKAHGVESDLKMVSFGRRGCKPFDYNINLFDETGNTIIGTHNIEVNSTQMELDGVFEDPDSIIIVEAKQDKRTDFITRQLYYPYRALSELADKSEKEIYNVFLTSSNGSIFAHVYKVDDKMSYNSMRQIDCVRYDFFEPISISDIKEIVNNVQIVDEKPDTIFPQADNMDRVFKTLEILSKNKGIGAVEIGEKMGLTGRQGGYYSNACLYLGLVDRVKSGAKYVYSLTDFGKELMKLPWKEKNLKMVEAISRHFVFNHFIRQYLDNQKRPDRAEITDWLSNNIDKLCADNGTPSRRASTVLGWIDWVIQITEYDNDY